MIGVSGEKGKSRIFKANTTGSLRTTTRNLSSEALVRGFLPTLLDTYREVVRVFRSPAVSGFSAKQNRQARTYRHSWYFGPLGMSQIKQRRTRNNVARPHQGDLGHTHHFSIRTMYEKSGRRLYTEHRSSALSQGPNQGRVLEVINGPKHRGVMFLIFRKNKRGETSIFSVGSLVLSQNFAVAS